MPRSRQQLLEELRPQVRDDRVLEAIAAVPRDVFVPGELQDQAWANEALPIGRGQTISQPLVVAHMCELLAVHEGARVLDVGTGSGYHAAVLAQLGGRVWSIERDPALSAQAAEHLARAGTRHVTLLVGDGCLGHPPEAPFDAINVAASARKRVPPALEAQLKPAGRLVAPVGERLIVVRRMPSGDFDRHDAGGVRFVPLVGED